MPRTASPPAPWATNADYDGHGGPAMHKYMPPIGGACARPDNFAGGCIPWCWPSAMCVCLVDLAGLGHKLKLNCIVVCKASVCHCIIGGALTGAIKPNIVVRKLVCLCNPVGTHNWRSAMSRPIRCATMCICRNCRCVRKLKHHGAMLLAAVRVVLTLCVSLRCSLLLRAFASSPFRMTG